MKKLFLMLPILFSLLLFSGFAEAHEGHRKKAENQTIKKEKTILNTQNPNVSHSVVPTKTEKKLPEPQKDEVKPSNWQEALWGHWHHKIVHFPIALGLFASLLLLINKENTQTFAQWALALAFACSILAFFTGQAMFDDFAPESPYFPLLERHRYLGIGSILMLGTSLFLSYRTRFQKWMWVCALILILSLSLTGFYGGWIAHG